MLQKLGLLSLHIQLMWKPLRPQERIMNQEEHWSITGGLEEEGSRNQVRKRAWPSQWEAWTRYGGRGIPGRACLPLPCHARGPPHPTTTHHKSSGGMPAIPIHRQHLPLSFPANQPNMAVYWLSVLRTQPKKTRLWENFLSVLNPKAFTCEEIWPGQDFFERRCS